MNIDKLEQNRIIAKVSRVLPTLLLPTVSLVFLFFGLSHGTLAKPIEQQESNLIRNPGFEQSSPAYWTHGPTLPWQLWWYHWSNAVYRSGGHSIEIGNNLSQYTLEWWSDYFSISPGMQHDFAGWIRTDGVANGARLLFALYSSQSDSALVAQYFSSQVSGTRDWVQVGATVVAPANAHYARIYCDLIGRGTAWFDDISVSPTSPKAFPVISKSGSPDPVEPGRSLRYTIYYSNTGDFTATQVIITDTYDANVQFNSADPTPDPGSNNRVWRIGTLGPNASSSIIVTVTVNSPLPDRTPLTNYVQMSFSGTIAVDDTLLTYVTSHPKLAVRKYAYPEIVEPGEYLTYTIVYKNTGTDIAHHVAITDFLPISVSYQSASIVPITSGNTLVWKNLGDLDVEDSRTITVTAKIKDLAREGDILCNQVQMNCDERSTDDDQACNRVPVFPVTIWPEYASTAPPSQPVCYIHQIYNADARVHPISITASSSHGWTTTVDSPLLNLGPQNGRAVTACVSIPADYGIISGTVDTLSVTATPVISPNQAETVRDITTIGRVLDRMTVTPIHGYAVNWSGQYPERSVFIHSIVNTGNYTDGFDLEISPDPFTNTCSLDMVQITPSSQKGVGPGAPFQVTVSITVTAVTPTCRIGFAVTSQTFPQTSTMFADEVGEPLFVYLPLVLKYYYYRAFCNGDFEIGDFSCWSNEGEFARSVQSDVKYEGSYAALLGSPDYSCDGVPVGAAWAAQEFSVPHCSGGLSPMLSFYYRILTQDHITWTNGTLGDSFDVYLQDSLILRDGYTDTNPIPGCRPARDLQWRYGSYDLSVYQGQLIEVLFENVTRQDNWYNTWTYLDKIEVGCRPQ